MRSSNHITVKRLRAQAKLLRKKVLRKSGFKCVFCGCTSDLTIDHIIPISLGGTSNLRNLQALCEPCNNTKGSNIDFRASFAHSHRTATPASKSGVLCYSLDAALQLSIPQ